MPFQVWTSLEGIDPSYGRYFDRVLEQRGLHAAKLNHLAMEVTHVAADDDLLMFLDGDAFTIADPMPLIEEGLAARPRCWPCAAPRTWTSHSRIRASA